MSYSWPDGCGSDRRSCGLQKGYYGADYRFIEATDREILQDAGKVTAEIAKAHAESEFEKYRIIQDRLFESDFDRMVKQLEQKNENKE